jgi:broad specificity phosphatase PhoE
MGRGWHHGKRVGYEGTQLLYRAGAPDRKGSGLPRLPLIASPYARALETAGIIAEQLNVPITVDPCWPQAQETEMIRQRSQSFRLWIAGGPWPQIGVVTHWGFIRALTGLKVPNGAVPRIDPTGPRRKPELLFVPGAG